MLPKPVKGNLLYTDYFSTGSNSTIAKLNELYVIEGYFTGKFIEFLLQSNLCQDNDITCLQNAIFSGYNFNIRY